MKSAIFGLLSLLAQATPIDFHDKRQLPPLGGLLSSFLSMGSAMKPASVIPLKPQVRSDSVRQQLVWGPFNFVGTDTPVAAANSMGMRMDPRGQINMRPMTGFCSDCSVLHGATYVSHADGSRVDVNEGAYLHHLLFLNPLNMGQSYYSCSSGDKAQNALAKFPSSYFLGAGVDKSEYFFAAPNKTDVESAYYINKRDSFIMQSEIVNYNPLPQKWYITVDYEYLPGRPSGAAQKDVSVTDFNVNNCFGFLEAGYKPPMHQKVFNKTSPAFTFEKAGTIVRAMGHLHDGGVRIELRLNGKVICDSRATYGGERGTLSTKEADGKEMTWETISDMTVCDSPVEVKKGDVMEMESFYDTALHPLRESTNGMEMEEMGIYTIFFAPTN